MIQQSFIMLDKIQKKRESRLWEQGIKSWDDFLKCKDVQGIDRKNKPYYDRRILEARKALYSFDSSFFARHLARSEMWRLYPYFREDCLFLDIETSGGNKGEEGFVTVVGMYDGNDTQVMVKDFNLDFKKLAQIIAGHKMIVTFNGSVFDLPFLRKQYPLKKEILHFDLRHLCARLGLSGGLKEVEKTLGITRSNPIVAGMKNGDPFTLWKMYKGSGDRKYLDLLVAYNEEDVVNLQPIADNVVKRMIEKLGF